MKAVIYLKTTSSASCHLNTILIVRPTCRWTPCHESARIDGFFRSYHKQHGSCNHGHSYSIKHTVLLDNNTDVCSGLEKCPSNKQWPGEQSKLAARPSKHHLSKVYNCFAQLEGGIVGWCSAKSRIDMLGSDYVVLADVDVSIIPRIIGIVLPLYIRVAVLVVVLHILGECRTSEC